MSNASADEHDSLNLAGMAGLYALDALEGSAVLGGHVGADAAPTLLGEPAAVAPLVEAGLQGTIANHGIPPGVEGGTDPFAAQVLQLTFCVSWF